MLNEILSIVTTLIVIGFGIPAGVSLMKALTRPSTRRAHYLPVALSTCTVVQYTHIFTREERARTDSWKGYRRDVYDACVETWLSATGRVTDLELFRKWKDDDARLKAELGIAMTHNAPGASRVPAGALLFLTLCPDDSAIAALDALLYHLDWQRVQRQLLPLPKGENGEWGDITDDEESDDEESEDDDDFLDVE